MQRKRKPLEGLGIEAPLMPFDLNVMSSNAALGGMVTRYLLAGISGRSTYVFVRGYGTRSLDDSAHHTRRAEMLQKMGVDASGAHQEMESAT